MMPTSRFDHLLDDGNAAPGRFDHLVDAAPKVGRFDHLAGSNAQGEMRSDSPASETDGVMKAPRGLDVFRAPWDDLRDAMGSPAHGAMDEGMVQRGSRLIGDSYRKDGFKGVSNALNSVAYDFVKKHPGLRILPGLEPEVDGKKPKKIHPHDARLDVISDTLDQLEGEQKTDSPEYKALETEFYNTLDDSEAKAPPSVPVVSALIDAFKDDALGMTMELANAVAADPAMLLIPEGYISASAKAAAAAAKYGKVAKVAAGVAGGMTGAAATGAAITGPISIVRQLDEDDAVNWEAVKKEMIVAGALSAPFAGLFRGVSNLSKVRFKRNPAEEAAAHQSAGAAATMDTASTLQEAMQDSYAKMSEVGRVIVEPFGMKSITKLDRPAKLSPSFMKVRNTLEYTEFSDVAIPPSFWERTYLETGRYTSRLQDQMDSLSGTFTKSMSKADNAQLIRHLRGELDFDGVGKGGRVAAAGKELRKLMDDVHDYVKKSGLEPGYVKGYFPRIYRANILRTDKGRVAFSKVLMEHGIDAEQADDIVRKIITDDGVYITPKKVSERVLNEKGEFTNERLGGGKHASENPRLERSRRLTSIPDEALAPFLDDNVYDVLSKYIGGAVNRAEYARAFGVGEGKVNSLLRKSMDEAAARGGQIKVEEVQRVYDLMDTMQRKYKPIASRALREANRGLGAYQLVRTLPLATISSLAEPLVILARGRTSSTLKAVPKILSHTSRSMIRSVFKKFPKSEATRALESVGIGLDIGITERLMASFGGETSRVTEKFFKLILLHQWTRLNRVAGYHAGRNMVSDNLRDLAKGVKGAKRTRYIQQLTELGVDVDEGVAWVNRGRPLDDPFEETMKAAGLRFTNEVVMDPRSTVRPMWHSDPHFHAVSQLKGFQTVFGNTVMKRFLHEVFTKGVKEGGRNAVKYATVGMMMIQVSMFGNELREYIKYGEKGNPRHKGESHYKKMIRAMDRAGFTGAFQMAIDATQGHRFGAPGVPQLMGPAVSQLEQLALGGVGKALDGNTAKLKTELTNAIPFMNANKDARNYVRENVVGPAVDAMPFPEKE